MHDNLVNLRYIFIFLVNTMSHGGWQKHSIADIRVTAHTASSIAIVKKYLL